MEFDALGMFRTVIGLAHGQGPLVNVADQVWLGEQAMRELDIHVRQLSEAAPADRVPTFEHGAYVLPDGALLLALMTNRGGFCFRVEAGGWGWTAPPS
jgi:hypothetical protein